MEENVIYSEIKKLFDLCEKGNVTLKSVDRYSSHKALSLIQKQSIVVFTLLENKVNSFSTKDFIKEIPDRKMLLRLYFIILKSLCLFYKKRVTMFEGERSQGSASLAHKLILELDFEHKFGQSQTWINNDTIYLEGFMVGLQKTHPTLLQNIVRSLTKTLAYPEIREQKIPEYMQKFENYIFYYLKDCNSDERIYLDFI